MNQRRNRRILFIPVVAALVLAACGDDEESESTTAPTTAPATDSTTGETAGVLAGICPEKVVIQTDWNPEAEHGFLYQMISPDDYSVDTDKVSVSGSLISSGGVDTGVDIEVRSGGPAIGFQTVTSQLYADESILLGYVYTDEAIQNSADFPTISIESGFEKNPQMIMWDPETYPDVKTIEDLGKTDAVVRYFGGAAYMEYFLAEGILSNVDGSYQGTPDLFLADEGTAAQQGFGSAEPYIYENEIEGWMKPIAYSYINDAGWENYAESIATKPENVTTYADCFTKLVPIIQQASVDFLGAPADANAIILDAVAKFDNGWVYSQGVADYGVKTILEDGLISNGPDDTVGNFDLDRVNALIEKAVPIYTALGNPPKEGLTAEDIVTNQFVDPSIGL